MGAKPVRIDSTSWAGLPCAKAIGVIWLVVLTALRKSRTRWWTTKFIIFVHTIWPLTAYSIATQGSPADALRLHIVTCRTRCSAWGRCWAGPEYFVIELINR